MSHFIVYREQKIPYTLITNKKLKNLSITISRENGVVVKNPGFSAKRVESFVLKKASWIEQKRDFISSIVDIQSLYKNEGKILLYGEKTPLHVTNLHDFYLSEAKKTVPPLIEAWSQKMEVSFKALRFRKTKRRWGSCNSKDELSFNPSMVQLPHETMQYLIVHELAHIKHKHHQRSFWNFVKKHMADYKIHENKIKKYSPQL